MILLKIKENVTAIATDRGIVFFSISFLSASVVSRFNFLSARRTRLTYINFLTGRYSSAARMSDDTQYHMSSSVVKKPPEKKGGIDIPP